MKSEATSTALDGMTLVYTYAELGTVRVAFTDGCVAFEWIAGAMAGEAGQGFSYLARDLGGDRWLVTWHEPEARGFVTLYLDLPAERACSSVLFGYGGDEEQVLFHDAVIGSIEGRPA